MHEILGAIAPSASQHYGGVSKTLHDLLKVSRVDVRVSTVHKTLNKRGLCGRVARMNHFSQQSINNTINVRQRVH